MLAAQVMVKVISQPSGTNVATLVIAVLGLLTALGSVVWQAVSYSRSGPRLRITMKRGYVGMGQMVSGPVKLDSTKQMADQGLTERFVGVEVTNVGRLPISIDGAEARMENGMAFMETGLSINPPAGTRIEPHSSKSWWVRWEMAVAMVQTTAAIGSEKSNRALKVRMMVKPTVGKPLTTKEHISISPR